MIQLRHQIEILQFTLLINAVAFQVFYFSTTLFYWAGLDNTNAKFATMGIGAIMVGMTLVSIMLMDRAGRRTLHLYGLGGMFIFSIFITISLLIKVSNHYLIPQCTKHAFPIHLQTSPIHMGFNVERVAFFPNGFHIK